MYFHRTCPLIPDARKSPATSRRTANNRLTRHAFDPQPTYLRRTVRHNCHQLSGVLLSIIREKCPLDQMDSLPGQQCLRGLLHHRRHEKNALMLTYGGRRPKRYFRPLSADKITPQPDTDERVFTKTATALSNYLNPKQNVEFQRYTNHGDVSVDREVLHSIHATGGNE